MPKQIENRVVEMEFKNKDFEKAVAVTMKSLEELNKKLDSLNDINMSGFEQMAHSMNNTNFDRLADSIDYIKSRFGLIGIAAQDIKEEIVSNMIQAASSIGNVFERIEGTIAEKGKSRATNLAQAKFQLKGLGIAWEDVSESIDMAVNDTRFGLDEAAMAASQLAASGVKLGDDMTHALLGISGVAAMTNSEYSDMAHIFTTVAGTGKLYTQQLNMIASRGLNAAAAIAKYMTEMKGSLVTEADVRQMLSSKDDFIDFHTFAEAMWDQYGEQAKKGNDLFTGAFANAKAALGRIGEKFYTPFYEYARQTLVAVKPVINDLNAALTPFFTSLSGAMENTKDVAVTVLGEIHKAFAGEDGKDYFIKIFGKTIDIKKELGEIIDWVSSLLDGIAATLNGSNGLMSVAGDSLLNIFYNIYSIIKLIGEAIYETFGAPTKGDIIYLLQTFQDWTNSLRLTDKKIGDIKSTLKGVLSIANIILKTADAIFRVFIVPLLKNIGWIREDILEMTGDIGEFFVHIDNSYEPFDPLFTAFAKFRAHISPALDSFDKLKTAISDTFVKVTGLENFNSLLMLIGETLANMHLENIVGGIFYGIAEAINFAGKRFEAFVALVEGDSSFKEYIKSMVESNSVLSWIKDTIIKIKTTLSDLIHGRITLSQALGLDKLKEHFEWLMPIIDEFKKHYQSIFDAYEGEDGKKGLPFIEQFSERLKDAIKNLKWEDIYGLIGAGFYAYWTKKKAEIGQKVAESVNVFSDAFKNLTEGINVSLVKLQKETNAEKILKIASGIALLAGSVFLLGKMNPNELKVGLGALVAICAMIVFVVGILSKAMETTEEFEKKYDLEKEGIKSKLESKSKGKGKKKSIIEMAFEKVASSFEYGEEQVTKTIKDLTAVPGIILSLGAAVFLIISAISKLGKAIVGLDGHEMLTIMIVTGAVLGAVGGIVGLLTKYVADHKEDIDTDILQSLSKMFLCFGIAIKLITDSVSKLAIVAHFVGPEEIGAAAFILAILIAEMGTVMWALANLGAGKITDENGKKKPGTVKPKALLAAGGAMLMMAAAIDMITVPLLSIIAATKIAGYGATWSSFGMISALLWEMFGIAALFCLVTSKLPGGIAGMLAGAGSMVMMGIAMDMLIAPITAITALSRYSKNGELEDAVTILNIIAIVMALMADIFGIVGAVGGPAAIAGIIAGAIGMVAMAKAIQKVSLALAGMVALETKFPGGVEKFFTDLANGISSICNFKIIAGMYALAIAAVILGAGLLLGGGGILAFGRGVKYAGEGILFFISALFLLQSIDFEQLGQNVANGGAAFIHGFVEAMKGGIPDIITGFVLWIAAGCEAITASTGLLSEACLKLLADVIIAIDVHAAELGFALGHAVMNIILYAATGIFAAGVDFIGMLFGLEKGEGMTTLVKKRLLEGKDSDQISEAEAKEMTMDMGHKIGKGFLSNIFEGIKSSAASGDSTLEGLKNVWSDGINKTLQGTSFLRGGLSGGMQTLSTSLGVTLAKSLFSIFNGDSEASSEVDKATEDVAKSTTESIAKDIDTQENKDEITEKAKSMLEGGLENVNAEDLYASLGVDSGEGFAGSFEDVLDFNNGESDRFKEIADSIPETMANSINGNSYKFEDAMKELGDKGYEAFHDSKLEFGSPSKAMIRFGEWSDEGLAIGINNSNKSKEALDEKVFGLVDIISSIGNLAKQSMSGSGLDIIRDTILTLTEAASSDMDFSPTITPILDLSNVNAGYSSLSELFSRNRSLALAGDVTNLHDANRMLNFQIQNDNNTQAINSLGARIDRLGDAIMNTQMVMDTGTVVGVMANPMDRELGRRAIQVKRGGARR